MKCPCYTTVKSTIPLPLSLLAPSLSLSLVTYWVHTMAPLPAKKDASRRVNPLGSLRFTHPASRPMDLPLYLRPSVGCTQPGMVLLDQLWRPCALWPQRRLDPWSWWNIVAAAFVALKSWQKDNVLAVEWHDSELPEHLCLWNVQQPLIWCQNSRFEPRIPSITLIWIREVGNADSAWLKEVELRLN